MFTRALDNQLEGVGRTVLGWRAQLRLLIAVTGVIAFVCLFINHFLFFIYGSDIWSGIDFVICLVWLYTGAFLGNQ